MSPQEEKPGGLTGVVGGDVHNGPLVAPFCGTTISLGSVNVTVPPDGLFELHVLLAARTAPGAAMAINAIAARTRLRIRGKAFARVDSVAGLIA
ncbi:MAG: hypothetical protein KGQ32_07520 [Xanthomonadaceae bacterium]|nr:hypothetical protein [Xanthomonadaceae bacterium]